MWGAVIPRCGDLCGEIRGEGGSSSDVGMWGELGGTEGNLVLTDSVAPLRVIIAPCLRTRMTRMKRIKSVLSDALALRGKPLSCGYPVFTDLIARDYITATKSVRTSDISLASPTQQSGSCRVSR